jgi:hypothetical protein
MPLAENLRQPHRVRLRISRPDEAACHFPEALRSASAFSVLQPNRYTSCSCENTPGTNRCTMRAPSRLRAAIRARRRGRNRTRRRRRSDRRSPARRSERPLRHADASQSGRPRSTSSTKSNWSAGRLRRSVSRSSAELTVIVQTVLRAACASSTHAATTTASQQQFQEPGHRRTASRRKKTRQYCTFALAAWRRPGGEPPADALRRVPGRRRGGESERRSGRGRRVI